MRTRTTILAAAGLMALLSACNDTMADGDMSGGGGMMQPVAGGPPFVEGSSGASSAAVDACQSALQAQVTGGVMVVGSEFSQANSAVYMRVGANGAPWTCLVGDDGSNPSLTFVGSEGAA